MTDAEKSHPMSYLEFVSSEQSSSVKREWVNGLVLPMAAASVEHARLQAALGRALGNALRGTACSVFLSDLRVRSTQTGFSSYPDLSIVRGRAESLPDDPNSIVNPTLIAEVLSDAHSTRTCHVDDVVQPPVPSHLD